VPRAKNHAPQARDRTLKTVILKLKLITRELRDDRSDFAEDIRSSAIADLSRIGRPGR
jgi:hypothetical protein